MNDNEVSGVTGVNEVRGVGGVSRRNMLRGTALGVLGAAALPASRDRNGVRRHRRYRLTARADR